MDERRYVLEIAFANDDCYYTISKTDLDAVMAEPDLRKRDSLILDKCKVARVSGSDDVDLTLVIDDQPAQERWSDFQEQLEDLE